MNLLIRLITPADFASCAQSLVAAFAEPPWNECWTFEQAHTRIDELMASRMSRGYVLSDDNIIIAMCIGRIMTYLDWQEFFVDEFSVHPVYQKQGLGGELLDYAKTQLSQENVNDMILNTEKGSPAVKFYEKNAFRIVDRVAFMSCEWE